MKFIIKLLKCLDWGSALAVRLTYWTGKASIPVHPKHLVDLGQWDYLPYINKTDLILDLGCHSGEHSFKAAKIAKFVTGLDINRRLLTLARKEAKNKNVKNVKFLSHNLEKTLPFVAKSFHKVFLFAVLEHLHHRDQILIEIRRVLRPRGQVFISVPNKNTAWKKMQQSMGLSGFSDPDHKTEFSQNGIYQLLKRHSFKNIKIRTTAIDTPLSGLIDLTGGLSLSIYKKLMWWKLDQGKLHPQESVGFLIKAHV